MNAIYSDRVYMRSLATRDAQAELSLITKDVIRMLKATDVDFIIVETSGIGQGDAAIEQLADLSLYVMTAEFGAPTQLERIDMIDFADFIAINKFEQKGSLDALAQVRKQYERSHLLFGVDHQSFPVFGTIASQFNDPGVFRLFSAIMEHFQTSFDWDIKLENKEASVQEERRTVIPKDRIHYLREISMTVRS